MSFYSSESSFFVEERITSEAKFEELRNKFIEKTRPRPRVIHGNPLWKRILEEHSDYVWYSMKQDESTLRHGIDTKEWKYLNKEIFPTLLPAIEETMYLAKRLKVEEGKFRAFNYLDTLIHYMLNLNLEPDEPVKMVEDFEEIKKHLEKFPKPSIPKHKIWSRHKAATLIQKNVRGWLVRKRPEVQEMIQFWKIMREKFATRVGPVFPRPLIPDYTKMANMQYELSSETDSTQYNNDKQFFKGKNTVDREDERKLFKLNLLKFAQKKSTTHMKHSKSVSQRERSRHHDQPQREVMVQTESHVYRSEVAGDKANPFHYKRGSQKRVRGRKKQKKHTKKPEISKEDVDVSVSFGDLNDKK